MLRIASACVTREAFVSVFGRYCDGEVIFVGTQSPRPRGEELNFRITLASGEPLIAATGRVEGSYPDGKGPHGRPGMLIRFLDVDPGSRALVQELAAVPPAESGSTGGRSSGEVAGEVSEPDSETRPSGLPRAVAGAGTPRSTTIPGPPLVPPPPDSLVIKPAATPPPDLVDPGAGRPTDDEGPTGVKSMQAIAASRRAVRQGDGRAHGGEPGGEFEDEASWDAGGDVFGERGGRVRLRPDSRGRLELPSVDGLVECAVFEESGPASQGEELGLPALIARRSSRPSDSWDDDPTIPPWLRGPVSDDDLDAASGAAETELMPQVAVAGMTETSAEAPAGPADATADSPSIALSGSFEREALAAVAAAEAMPGRHDPVRAPPRRRWPLAVLSAAVTGALGLVAGYAIGSGSVPGLSQVAEDGEDGDAASGPSASGKPTWAARSAAGGAGSGALPPGEAGEADGLAGGAAGALDDAADRDGDDAAGEDRDDSKREDLGVRKGKRWLRRDRCGVDVRSDPDGAEVLFAEQSMGTTPARFELPCGAQEITLRRSRYADSVRRVRLRPGKPDRVEVDLDRPDHKLRIITAPLGANVTVSGRPAGTTPLVATVRGYTHVRVRIERPGFEPVTRKVYAREPMTKLTVKLTPEKGSGSGSGSGSSSSAPARIPAQSPIGAPPAQPATSPPPLTPGLTDPPTDAAGNSGTLPQR